MSSWIEATVGCRAWQDSAQVPWGFLWYLEGCCANQTTLYSQYFTSFYFLALTHYGSLSFLWIVKQTSNLAISDNEYGCNAVQLIRALQVLFNGCRKRIVPFQFQSTYQFQSIHVPAAEKLIHFTAISADIILVAMICHKQKLHNKAY